MRNSTINIGPQDGTAVLETGVPLPRLLDLKAAAAYTSLSYWTLREYVFSGVLASVKLPGPRSKDGKPLRRILIDRADLDRLIESCREVEL